MAHREGQPLAVVVGICVHGLAMVRSLAKRGIEVHVLEANRRLPGNATRRARIHAVEEINGPGLIPALVRLHGELKPSEPPVLMLTNDNMVRVVGERWDELDGRYRLSWRDSRESALRLLGKGALQAHCEARKLAYPRSWLIGSGEEARRLAKKVAYPAIVKPDRPLSRFKAKRVSTEAELCRICSDYASELPMLVQEWIPGDDTEIYICGLYLLDGEILASFEGQKLASLPRALGQTTAARSCPNKAVRAAATRFFQNSGISGPAGLELKKNRDGQLFVIEPTLGRTDYWVDCSIANGVDLPYFEYQHQIGGALPSVRQVDKAVWYDTERELLLYWSLLPRHWGTVLHKLPVWPYFRAADSGPFFRAMTQMGQRVGKAIRRRLRRAAGASTEMNAPH